MTLLHIANAPVFTACGKVILLGEHGVVHGRPALAAGLAEGVRAAFVAEPAVPGLTLHVQPWDVSLQAGDGTDLGRALDRLIETLPGEPSCTAAGRVEAELRLPGGGGLGSSAALGVAVARALAHARLGRAPQNAEIEPAVQAWERVFHGNPSGIDQAMALHGGAGIYRRSSGLTAVHVASPLRVLFADSGERQPTRVMVEHVAARREADPQGVDARFDAIAALVRAGVDALGRGDAAALGRAMDENHAHLAALGLSTDRLDALAVAARGAGAWGAKLTGGGGGGCVIALAPAGRESSVLAAWRAVGAEVFTADVGAVRVERVSQAGAAC